MAATARLKARARELGFEAVGVATVGPLEAQEHYEAWLAAGRHGDMHWLASDTHRARRREPERLVAGIRSVVCVAMCHPPERDTERDARVGRIARYAAGEDYHRIMKDRLLELERWIQHDLFPGSGSLWYADTGAIPRELRPAIGDWIFGCDLCQEACPWNRFAPAAREARLHAHTLEGWSLERFLTLDEPTFRELFATSPIRRADRGGFLRNVCVAMGNRGAARYAAPLTATLERDPEAIVRAHAAWALGRVAMAAAGSRSAAHGALTRAAAHDPDALVREEASLAVAALD